MNRACFIVGAVILGIGFVLEILGLSAYRYAFLFSGLMAVALGHSV